MVGELRAPVTLEPVRVSSPTAADAAMLRQHQPDRVPDHHGAGGIGGVATLASPFAGCGDTPAAESGRRAGRPRGAARTDSPVGHGHGCVRYRCLRAVVASRPGCAHSTDQEAKLIAVAIPTTAAAITSTTGTTVHTSFTIFMFRSVHSWIRRSRKLRKVNCGTTARSWQR